MDNSGATVVISHHIKSGKQEQYELWLNEIGPVCRSAHGNIDWQMIRPLPGLTYVYTIIIRFDTIVNLRAWMESATRRELIKKVKPLLAADDRYYIKTGLDFLFNAESENKKQPPAWKQFIVTWSAIYPLSIMVPLLVLPILTAINFPINTFLNAFIISGTIVFLMVYIVMPAYTRFLRTWLFK